MPQTNKRIYGLRTYSLLSNQVTRSLDQNGQLVPAVKAVKKAAGNLLEAIYRQQTNPAQTSAEARSSLGLRANPPFDR